MDTDKERQIDHLIHYTLLAGVSTSAILLTLGLLIILVRDTPRPEVAPPLSEILHQAFMANGVDLLYLGLLLLMITPVARVMMLVYGYARIGWWRFALISLLVMVLLSIGLTLGIGG
jgi:uncharacterized membrane protein